VVGRRQGQVLAVDAKDGFDRLRVEVPVARRQPLGDPRCLRRALDILEVLLATPAIHRHDRDQAAPRDEPDKQQPPLEFRHQGGSICVGVAGPPLHSAAMIDWTPGAVALQIGPFSLWWYGLAYAVGLAVAYALMVRQARRLGEDPAIIGNGLIVIAIAALIGGRLYHVIDQWQLYQADLLKIVLPPYSGLGVFGGFVTGTIAFIWLTRHYRVSAWRWADIVAPGLFAMQAIGRWGNFFNQELYGPPTTLPWGIRIDCEHRVVDYPCDAFPLLTTHFHPLFLYESLSAVIGLVVILWLTRNPPRWLRTGDARFLLEFLRIGNWRLADIPTAQIFGAGFVVIGVAALWVRRRQGAPPFLQGTEARARPDADGDDPDDVDDEHLFDDIDNPHPDAADASEPAVEASAPADEAEPVDPPRP
jgi:phosphatidylglycerol:prolipoprotein diacylglycerol transferase